MLLVQDFSLNNLKKRKRNPTAFARLPTTNLKSGPIFKKFHLIELQGLCYQICKPNIFQVTRFF